jgi:predicted ATPase/tetratricopeptide (TPR) repeat protein
LSTSREPLGIDGEAVYRVPPLAVPDIHLHLSSVNLIQYDAIRLFTERAAVVFPGFTLDAQSGSAVLQICRRLDGIPLAIELAAARVKMSQVEEIAQHLEDRFRLLTGGSRAALPRYQTLRASIDWSYMLLTGAEQTLLQCLSVFAGGWTLEAAESVGNGEEVDAGEVINLLGGLVDKSLVNVMRESGRETRYRMLETIRQYAHEKLVESGQSAAVCDRHLQYYVDLAERLEDKIRGRVGDQVRSRLDSELEDIRLAQTWSLEGSDRPGWNPEPGLRLAAALHWFWIINTLWEEERPWLVRLLALEAQSRGDQPAREARARIRARALFTASYMTMTIGEHKPAREMITESRELFRGLGPQDVRGYAFATWVLSEIESSLGELLRAKLLVEESLAFFRTTGDRFGEFDCLFTLGNIASQQMAYEQASQYYQASLEIRQEVGDTGIPLMLMSLARMLLNQWEFEKARPILEQSLQLASEYQDNYSLPLDLAYLGRIDWMAGQYEQAARNFEEIIGFGRRIGTAWIVHIGLAQMGKLALSQGDTVQAGDWLGQSLALARKMERKDLIAISLCGLGSLALDQGRIEQAAEAYAEVLALSQERGDKIYEMIATFGLGKVEHARHDRLLAQKNYLEALDMCSDQLFLEYEKEVTIEALAFVAVDQQQFDRAALLLGASEAWHVKFQRWRTPRERQERESAITALRVGMGEKAFATAWAEGVATSSNQALDEARKIR